MPLFIFIIHYQASYSASNRNFFKEHGRLNFLGTKLVDENDEIVVLRGVSLESHALEPQFYEYNVIEQLVNNWNANLIRAVIDVDLELENNYIDKPDFALQCLERVINASIQLGVYVIVDFHSKDPSLYLKEAKQFFFDIANEYKNYPNIIYEILGEPFLIDNWEEYKNYSYEVIKEIRKIDKLNIILVGNPNFGIIEREVANNPIMGYINVAYALHFFAFSNRDSARNNADYALKKGLPVFISECGSMDATEGGNFDDEEWGRWVSWMNRNQISWVAWRISNLNQSSAMLNTNTNLEGKWKDEDLTPWGQTVKELLQLNNS